MYQLVGDRVGYPGRAGIRRRSPTADEWLVTADGCRVPRFVGSHSPFIVWTRSTVGRTVGSMATEVPAPGVLEGEFIAGRLEWLCHAVRAECACSVEDRPSACDAWERQLDLALDCYGQRDDAAALAISDRLDEQMRAWAAGKDAPSPEAGGPAAAASGKSGRSREQTDHR
jgi:hypothetical protein